MIYRLTLFPLHPVQALTELEGVQGLQHLKRNSSGFISVYGDFI